MVNHKSRKTTRQSWSEPVMSEAIRAVKEGRMGYLKASKTFCVPKTTLIRRVKDTNKLAKGALKFLGNKSSLLPKAVENELYSYILKMEESLFGLTPDDLRSMAFELAARNGIPNNFNKELKKAGWSWYQGFRRRYPTLSVRTPENTSMSRARGFNEQSVESFFSLLKELQSTHQFPSDRIFNVDEKGVSTVPNHPPKIVALKGRKQVGGLASGEKGTTTTLVLCGSASGYYVPPLFIFPRVNNNPQLMIGAPAGSIQENFSTGWIQTHIFLKWFEHFVRHTNSSVHNPSLLILDGHSTHTKNLKLLDLARDSGVSILCLPPHTTHRLQPLDVCVMKPLSTNLSLESKRFMFQNPGSAITLYQVAAIFGKAYQKGCTSASIISGFEKCGIHPIDQERFSEMYSAASVTNIPILSDAPNQTPGPSDAPHQTPGPSDATDLPQGPSDAPDQTSRPGDVPDQTPGPSYDPDQTPGPSDVPDLTPGPSDAPDQTPGYSDVPDQTPGPSDVPDQTPGPSRGFIMPQSIVPIPHVDEEKERLKRRKKTKATGKAAILTSSPYRNELSKDEQIKQLKEQLKLANQKRKGQIICE